MTELLTTKIYSGETLLKLKITEIPMVFDGLIPMVGIWMLIGASDTGKSMILRQMGICTAAKKAFLNHAYNGKYGKVIIVSSEDDEFAISYLLNKQNTTLGITETEAANIRYIFDTSDLLPTLEKALIEQPVDLIIIDALGDIFNGKDLNQNNQVRAFLNEYSQLAGKYKCSIGFLHHTGKRTEDLAPSKNNSIGSQGIEAKARLVIELRLDKENTDLRHLCIVKGNYLPAEAKTSSYVLKMDENLCFSDTGNRTNFDDLIAGKGGKTASPAKHPQTYDDKFHIEFLASTFQPIDKVYSGSQLNEAVQTKFHVSDKPAREFIQHYKRHEWINPTIKSPRLTEYRLNLSQGTLKFAS